MTENNKLIFENYRTDIEACLKTLFSDKPEYQKAVCDAMEYSLMAGGKRIRPVLTLEFCRMCGGDPSAVTDIACTLEMIHTFSLIHDDLPCMDNDDFRRGRPSCHKQFNEALALLAGDALNTLPFEIIAKKAVKQEISFETAVKVAGVLAESVGVNGMIGGQVIDMDSENKSISIDELNLLQSLKTGALIKAACKIGCILGGRDDLCEAAGEYADSLGRAFQIIDDILDVKGSFEELGKPIGSDEEQNKSTYVSLMGLERAEAEAKRLTAEAVRSLEAFDDSRFLKDLTEYLLIRKN